MARKKFTQSQIVSILSEEFSISKKTITTIIDRLGEVIVEQAKNPEYDGVSIGILGVFRVKETKARRARNMATGESIMVPPGKRFALKASTAIFK